MRTCNGQDMDETVFTIAAKHAWSVAFEPADRDFIGRSALEAQKKSQVRKKLVGFGDARKRAFCAPGLKVIVDGGEA